MSSAIGGPSSPTPSFDLPEPADGAEPGAAPAAAAVSRVPASSQVRPGPAAPYGTIALGGATIPREAPPTTPLTPLQSEALGAIRRGLLSIPPGFVDWRSPEEAEKVAALEPARGADGEPLSFGDLAIVRPGGTNITPGAAFLFRVAQHAGKTVVAYQNMSDPAQNDVHPLDVYDGVPVPPALKGKIFAVGSPAPCAIAYDQASDQFLEALEIMHEQKAALGVDPLAARATVLANSEGTLEVPLTRARLEKSGLPNAIGRFVAISGAAGAANTDDTALAVEIAGRLTAAGADALGPEAVDWHRYLDVLDRLDLEKRFTPDMRRMTDLSISSVIGPGAPLFGVFGGGDNIRPGMRAAAILDNLAGLLKTPLEDWTVDDLAETIGGGSRRSDGLLTTRMGDFARKAIVAKTPHDHAGMIEDPAIVDEILRNLPRSEAQP